MIISIIILFSFEIDQYNRDRNHIESDLAAIRVAVETRTRSAIQNINDQRDLLIGHIDEHIDKEQMINRYNIYL